MQNSTHPDCWYAQGTFLSAARAPSRFLLIKVRCPLASERPCLMVVRPPTQNAYEFVVVSFLRAQQLMGGSVPRVITGDHKKTVIAQMEVAAGRVARIPSDVPVK